MYSSAQISSFQDKISLWFSNAVWTVDTLTQIFILGLIFVAAALIDRFTAVRIVNAINQWQGPPKFKQMLHTLRRLLLPFTALILLFFVRVIDAFGVFPDGDIFAAVMNLLVAWIIIRLALQIITNTFIRNIVATIVWSIAALSILGVLDETATALDALGMNIGTFRISPLTLMKGVFALALLLYVASFLSSLIEKRVLVSSGLTVSSRVLLSKIIRVVLIVFALLMGITAAGIDLTALAFFSGALGLGLGFGLQKGISNLFSGMLLLMDKSITPGDIIELPNGAFGWVQHMGARYTEIITRDNKSFLIPNEDFITHQVVNWSHGDTLIRLEVKFSVHYDNDPHMVKEISQEAARQPERVVDNPLPICHLFSFDDGALTFVLRFWIRDAEKGVTNMRGDVLLAIWDAFKANGIRLTFPHRELFIHDMADHPFPRQRTQTPANPGPAALFPGDDTEKAPS